MNSIQDLFSKFKTIISSSTDTKNSVVASFARVAGITLKPEEIMIKDRVVYINSHPSVRSEIYMRKKLLLAEFQNNLATRLLRDIR